MAIPFAIADLVSDLGKNILLVSSRLTTLCDNNAAENGEAPLQKKRGDK